MWHCPLSYEKSVGFYTLTCIPWEIAQTPRCLTYLHVSSLVTRWCEINCLRLVWADRLCWQNVFYSVVCVLFYCVSQILQDFQLLYPQFANNLFNHWSAALADRCIKQCDVESPTWRRKFLINSVDALTEGKTPSVIERLNSFQIESEWHIFSKGKFSYLRHFKLSHF